jgi:hypothetical protein
MDSRIVARQMETWIILFYRYEMDKLQIFLYQLPMLWRFPHRRPDREKSPSPIKIFSSTFNVFIMKSICISRDSRDNCKFRLTDQSIQLVNPEFSQAQRSLFPPESGTQLE